MAELALERSGNRARHGLRACPGQLRLNLNSGKIDRGKWRDRQGAKGGDASQRERDRQQSRTDGVADEEFGETHGSLRAQAVAVCRGRRARLAPSLAQALKVQKHD